MVKARISLAVTYVLGMLADVGRKLVALDPTPPPTPTVGLILSDFSAKADALSDLADAKTRESEELFREADAAEYRAVQAVKESERANDAAMSLRNLFPAAFTANL